MKPSMKSSVSFPTPRPVPGIAIALLLVAASPALASTPPTQHKGTAHKQIILQHHHHAIGKTGAHRNIILQHHHH